MNGVPGLPSAELRYAKLTSSPPFAQRPAARRAGRAHLSRVAVIAHHLRLQVRDARQNTSVQACLGSLRLRLGLIKRLAATDSHRPRSRGGSWTLVSAGLPNRRRGWFVGPGESGGRCAAVFPDDSQATLTAVRHAPDESCPYAVSHRGATTELGTTKESHER